MKGKATNQPQQQRSRFKKNNQIRSAGLIFDKIAFVLPMESYQDTQATINALTCLPSNRSVEIKTRYCVDGFIALALCFKQQGRGRRKAIVQIVVSATKRRMRIEYNSSKINKEAIQYLDIVIQNVTGHDSFLGYCMAAHISRLDVCYDLKGFDIRDHVLAVKRFRQGCSWADGDRPDEEGNYSHQTVVFGTRGGNSIVVYDKVAQDPAAYPYERAVTRFEVRLRPQAYSFHLADLVCLENRFTRIQVFSRYLVNPPSAPKGFVMVWRRRGFAKACKAKKVDAYTREKILKECKGAEYPFWQSVWKHWEQDVLNGLKACGLYEGVSFAMSKDSAADKAT